MWVSINPSNDHNISSYQGTSQRHVMKGWRLRWSRPAHQILVWYLVAQQTRERPLTVTTALLRTAGAPTNLNVTTVYSTLQSFRDTVPLSRDSDRLNLLPLTSRTRWGAHIYRQHHGSHRPLLYGLVDRNFCARNAHRSLRVQGEVSCGYLWLNACPMIRVEPTPTLTLPSTFTGGTLYHSLNTTPSEADQSSRVHRPMG